VGFVTVTDESRGLSGFMRLRLHPATVLWLRLEVSQRGTGDEVALNIEIIVDGGMGAEKAPGGSC